MRHHALRMYSVVYVLQSFGYFVQLWFLNFLKLGTGTIFILFFSEGKCGIKAWGSTLLSMWIHGFAAKVLNQIKLLSLHYSVGDAQFHVISKVLSIKHLTPFTLFS